MGEDFQQNRNLSILLNSKAFQSLTLQTEVLFPFKKSTKSSVVESPNWYHLPLFGRLPNIISFESQTEMSLITQQIADKTGKLEET